MTRCAWLGIWSSGASPKWAENIGKVAVHPGSRHTSPPISHWFAFVSNLLILDRSGEAVTCESAVPFRSPLAVLKLITLLTFCGPPQFQASCSASATIAGSSLTRWSSACGSPTPHALTGCDRSVQLIVLELHEVVVKPAMPMPERMFHVATLNVRGADCASAAELGAAGLAASDPWQAPAIAASPIASSARRADFKGTIAWQCQQIPSSRRGCGRPRIAEIFLSFRLRTAGRS